MEKTDVIFELQLKDIGSKLLSKMLNLTDTQGGVLAIAFKIAKDEELDLIDLNDLKAILTYIGEKRKRIFTYIWKCYFAKYWFNSKKYFISSRRRRGFFLLVFLLLI